MNSNTFLPFKQPGSNQFALSPYSLYAGFQCKGINIDTKKQVTRPPYLERLGTW